MGALISLLFDTDQIRERREKASHVGRIMIETAAVALLENCKGANMRSVIDVHEAIINYLLA